MYSEFNKVFYRSVNGDKDAMAELLDMLKPIVISSIRRYYNRFDQYEDLIQEGYEVIIRALDDFDEERDVKFLGYVKARLKFYYLGKHRQKEVRLSLNAPVSEDGGELVDFIADDGLGTLEILLRDEELRNLRISLLVLSERQRKVILLYYIEGLKIDDIAKVLDVTYRTVVNTKVKALKKLREIINL